MPILCPICQKDDKIQKVSSAYDHGINFGSYRGPATTATYSQGKAGVAGTYISGTTASATSQAMKLAPPIAPKKPVFPYYILVGLIAAFVGFCVCAGGVLPPLFTAGGISDNAVEGFLLYTVCCAALPMGLGSASIIWGIVTWQQNVHSYPGRLAAFNKALEVWNRQYYCERDDAVFDPTTGEYWQFKRTS